MDDLTPYVQDEIASSEGNTLVYFLFLFFPFGITYVRGETITEKTKPTKKPGVWSVQSRVPSVSIFGIGLFGVRFRFAL